MRAHVNEFWAVHFPDAHDRPARHAIVHDLPAGMLVQLEIVAVVERP
jgi:2-iminobutanoate/2-iminopropanoate deaminase